MHFGMTGTRNGMTEAQRKEFERVLEFNVRLHSAMSFHHGDCVGADAETHEIASRAGLNVIIHPPIKADLRAYCVSDEIREEKGYLARNRDIVNESDVMFGLAPTMKPRKGGTWYTINYAKTNGKEVWVISPDGTLEVFNEKPAKQIPWPNEVVK